MPSGSGKNKAEVYSVPHDINHEMRPRLEVSTTASGKHQWRISLYAEGDDADALDAAFARLEALEQRFHDRYGC
jgi:DNA-directed RNA polymerase subunit L